MLLHCKMLPYNERIKAGEAKESVCSSHLNVTSFAHSTFSCLLAIINLIANLAVMSCFEFLQLCFELKQKECFLFFVQCFSQLMQLKIILLLVKINNKILKNKHSTGTAKKLSFLPDQDITNFCCLA